MKTMKYLSLICLFAFTNVANASVTLEELVTLNIDQADYHRKNEPADHRFATQVKTIYDRNNVTEDKVKNYRYVSQVAIPVTKFMPKPQDGQTPNNTYIIHTHGGPSSHIRKNTPHAAISYYMDNGLPVIAVNYRGSTGFDKKFKDMAEGKLPVWGVQDVDSVAHMLAKDGRKVILAGGSFGSAVNSQLVAKEKGNPLFAGAHFTGGTKYPHGEEMPRDVPLLIAHGLLDEIVPFEMGARFALQMLYAGYENVQFIGAERGDHHMISPMLTEPVDCVEMRELQSYLATSTAFIQAISKGLKPEITPAAKQIKRIESLLYQANHKKINKKAVKQRIKHKKKLMPMLAEFSPPLTLESLNFPAPVTFVGPTMNHLKLVMGRDFSSNVDIALKEFFFRHFRPVNWPSRNEFDTLSGLDMSVDRPFREDCRDMIYGEEEFLRANPDHMVIYHTAPEDGMRFYMWITMVKAFLQGRPATEMRDFRLFDSLGATFQDVNVFLAHMHAQHSKDDSEEKIFNNVKGFPQRAIAGVPFLTASRFNTAACSIFWHYKAAQRAQNTPPYKKVMKQLFKIMGIYSKARVERYRELFELDQAEVKASHQNQSVLQQIFVPQTYADEHGYNCQMWGNELGTSAEDLTKPSIVRELQTNPAEFEARLARNKSAFTNPEEIEYEQQPLFSDLLQLRLVVRPEGITKVNSYIRSPELFDSFAQRLQREVLWDFADFIVAGKSIPKVLIPDAIEFPNALRKRLGMDVSKDDYTPYIRSRMFKALVAPSKTLHTLCSNLRERLGEVSPVLVGATYDEIHDCQKILMEGNLDENLKDRPTYSPCYYLEGYTYYSLLMEAIDSLLTEAQEATYPHPSYPAYLAKLRARQKAILIGAINMFADPSSATEKAINRTRYRELKDLANSLLEYKRDYSKHRLFQRDPRGMRYEHDLWSQELTNATLSFLNNARRACDAENDLKVFRDKKRDFYFAVIEPLDAADEERF